MKGIFFGRLQLFVVIVDGFPDASGLKNLPEMQALQEMQIWSLGWEDPLEKEKGNPLQYSCLKNPMDREAWQAAEVAELDMMAHTHTHIEQLVVILAFS